jgi:hypothetical protein
MTSKNKQRRKTGNGVKQAKAKCGGPSTAAAKSAASGRDDGERRLGEGRTGKGKGKGNGKGQYRDSGCARMTTRGNDDSCGLRQNDDEGE